MLLTRTPDKTWVEKANQNGFTRSHVFCDGGLESLKHRLLDIGGWAVCLPRIEDDLKKIMTRGRKFAGRSISMPGEDCACHSNSAFLWDANRDQLYICTGYALSKDGMWRQHSWCVKPTKKSWRVVETTLKRIQYYGYIMHETEAEQFLQDNL